MFNNVEDLEKQVKEFQDNILASNKLVTGIDELTKAVKEQQTVLSASLSSQISKLDKGNSDYISSMSQQISKLNKENDNHVSSLSDQIFKLDKENSNYVASLFEQISKLNKENSTHVSSLSDQISKLDKRNSDYISSMSNQISKLDKGNSEYVSSLSEQISKLDNDNSGHISSLSEQILNLSKENEEYSKALESLSKRNICEAQKQMQLIKEDTDRLQEKIRLEIEKLKELAEHMVQEVTSCSQSEICNAVEQFKAETLSLDNSFTKKMQELEISNEKSLEKTTEQIVLVQKDYFNELKYTQEKIQTLYDALNQKYQDFLERLEKTNVDQLFKLFQEIKASVDKKFFVLLGGLGLVGILALLSIILH